MPPYSVLVVEDERIIRKNIVSKVNRASDAFLVCADVSSGMEAWNQIQKLRPHVVFIDINIPEINGLELVRLIKSRYPKILSVIISGYSNFDYARQAIGYGAFDYLLKPVKQSSMNEILGKIKFNLDLSLLGNVRDIVFIGNQDKPSYQLPSELPGKFEIALICVGNLPSPFPDEEQDALYEILWSRLDLQNLLTTIRRERDVLWVVDEMAENQKLLLFPSWQDEDSDIFLEDLLEHARKLAAPYPFSIFKGTDGVYYNDIWNQANLIRSFAERRFVAGKSGIISDGATQNIPLLSAQDVFFKLYVLLCNDEEAFAKEFAALMLRWNQENQPQRKIEAEIVKFFHYILSQPDTVRQSHTESAERELSLSAALSPDMPSWAERVSEQFILLKTFKNLGDTEDIAIKIKNYITDHYTLPVTIEEIARNFAFSQTYLTKIFKKHCGVTPLKYLISLRIERAKQMLAARPELDVKEVAQAVGYEDPHYFSRLFKNNMGQSPSEYRQA